MLKKFVVTLSVFSMIFTLSTVNSNALSITDGKDSKGTYTLYSYTAQDLKNRIKSTGRTIRYYESNAYEYGQLLTDSLLGLYYPKTAFFLGVSQIKYKQSIINSHKSRQAEYRKLLSIANASKHGVRVKRYYQRHYATGLGMVKGYTGNIQIYPY